MFWVFIAYFLTPLGILTCTLLLSNIRRLEQVGKRMCSLRIQVGKVDLQVDKLIVLFASALFANETIRANSAEKIQDADKISAAMQDRAKMNKWRHERNYWISLYLLTLWAVAWRVNVLLAAGITRTSTIKSTSTSSSTVLTGTLNPETSSKQTSEKTTKLS
jgi:hypothetical protein